MSKTIIPEAEGVQIGDIILFSDGQQMVVTATNISQMTATVSRQPWTLRRIWFSIRHFFNELFWRIRCVFIRDDEDEL